LTAAGDRKKKRESAEGKQMKVNVEERGVNKSNGHSQPTTQPQNNKEGKKRDTTNKGVSANSKPGERKKYDNYKRG